MSARDLETLLGEPQSMVDWSGTDAANWLMSKVFSLRPGFAMLAIIDTGP